MVLDREATRKLRKASPKSIVVADIDPDALRYARRLNKQTAIEFLQTDACEHWSHKKYDTIFSCETTHHVPRPGVRLP